MRMSGIGIASPSKSVSTPAMIRSSVDLPEPFRPSTPILAPGKERQGDVLEDWPLGRNDLAHAVHRVDVLGHGGSRGMGRERLDYRRRRRINEKAAASAALLLFRFRCYWRAVVGTTFVETSANARNSLQRLLSAS